MARAAADALADKKGIDIMMLEVGDLLAITEYFLFATGTSRPHVKALSQGVEERLQELDRKALRREGVAEAEWVLLDYGDFVVHVFQAKARDYYRLERMWGDGSSIDYDLMFPLPSAHQ